MANPLFQGFDDDSGQAPRYDEAVFLRLGVEEGELEDGFPDDAEDLFDYHLVIWGDVEREFFASRHLDLTRRFVSQRGGSLLLLGGPRGLAEGGYRSTVIEGILPVTLGRPDVETATDLRYKAEPTVDGMLSGIFSLESDPAGNRAAWSALPELFGLNSTLGTRAGATVLARASASGNRDGHPLYAWQPFGEGRTAVLAAGETWQWHMLRDEDAEGEVDGMHAEFWRQLVRNLVHSVTEPVTLTARNDLLVARADTLHIVVRDSLYEVRDGVTVRVDVSGPDGSTRALPVEESIERSGSYSVPVRFDRPGTYLVSVVATDGNDCGKEIGRATSAFYVHPDHRERISTRYDREFLRSIARKTGGRFYELEDMDRLVDDLPPAPGGEEHVDRISLWHLPAAYGMLVALFCLEWLIRRRHGHP